MDFAGIINENDFFSQHYLNEVFPGDLERIIKEERRGSPKGQDGDVSAGAYAGGSEGRPQRASAWEGLGAVARKYVQDLLTLRDERDPQQRLEIQNRLLSYLAAGLGYSLLCTDETKSFTLECGLHLPLCFRLNLGSGMPYLWGFQVTDTAFESEDSDPLNTTLPEWLSGGLDFGYKGKLLELSQAPWHEILDKGVFSQDFCPRWVILAGSAQWVLLERLKYAQHRVLRFGWQTVFMRPAKRAADDKELQAAALLLRPQAFLAAGGQQCQMDELDGNSHRHASGVSADLKYAMRRSVELLGNEAARQIRRKRIAKHLKLWSDEELAGRLTSELLRYMYRILFILFVESRPELNYVPVSDRNYMTSYSAESLRCLENVPLVSSEDREGSYFHRTIEILTSFFSHGTPGTADSLKSQTVNRFVLAGLNSRLFADNPDSVLREVVFPNYVLQQVIRWMSLAQPAGSKGRAGRISYAHLGVNQLGAVYESLLSYQGFFAAEDLYEVKAADGSSDVDELAPAYFVGESELGSYSEAEKVYEKDAHTGEKRLRVHPKGSFIYRMSGRARESSASYYTPEVLTRCVVSQSLEVLREQQLDALPDDKARAERVLSWKVCEPAMGSAAFLNEAVNQLAALYLQYAMKIPGARKLTQSEYTLELQKVKMYMADRNLFGVDLNQTAVELGEVSVWLNALSQDRYVPDFTGRFYCGNSLIGCRREAYYAWELKDRSGTLRPHPVGPEGLKDDEIWHFLVPDPGMANYTDNDVKKVMPVAVKTMNAWRRQFSARGLDDTELKTLKELSRQIETHWQNYARELRQVRLDNLSHYPVYMHDDAYNLGHGIRDYAAREKAFGTVQGHAGLYDTDEFSVLRKIMNYWCALWFWPLQKTADLPPTYEVFLADVRRHLESIGVHDAVLQDGSENAGEDGAEPLHRLFDGEDAFKRRQAVVESLASRLKFLHWPLRFADVLLPDSDGQSGFDLTLGNPPWAVISFNTGTILGDLEPRFAIRSHEYSAKVMQDVLLGKAELTEGKTFFERRSGAKDYWLAAYEEVAGSQNFFNSDALYPELKGSSTNLFKVFLPVIWRNQSVQGVAGVLHQEMPYIETNALNLREVLYHRVRKHYHFINVLRLFDIDTRNEFGVNVYGKWRESPDFESISNLFLPQTIDESHNECSAEVADVKGKYGNWNAAGHPERILHYDSETLRKIAGIFSTEPTAPILPSIHVAGMLRILEGFAPCGRLGDLQHKISRMWDETNAQKDGIITALPGNATAFPEDAGSVILNGPHIFVSCPVFKIPDNPCPNSSQWSMPDLSDLPDDYLPRCKYRPCLERAEYTGLIESLPWAVAKHSFVATYRVALREMVNSKNERTLMAAIIPPGFSHVHLVESIAFAHDQDLITVAAVFASLPADFYIRILNKQFMLPQILRSIPLPNLTSFQRQALAARILGLNCLTTYYADLWERNFTPDFCQECFASDDRALSQNYFANLTPNWQASCALRTDLERRQALLEIDVLSAMGYGISLADLETCYRLGFRVLADYEAATYYDQSGRIVCTPNRQLGKGLPLKGKAETDVTWAVDGAVTEALGFEDVKDKKSGTVSKTFRDDTLPGGPKTRTITWQAPFFTRDRLADYAAAWRHFSAEEKR